MLGCACIAVIGPTVAVSFTQAAFAQDAPPPPAPTDPNNMAAAQQPAEDPNVEVMTRGPVHEAYAMPVSQGQAAAGVVVPRQPPAAVDEVPPDMKPDSEKATWIPGYWSWDDDRKDFIWVSGVWRVPPPGFRWMPGYWQDNQGQGYQWISGYWMPAHLQEATFMPQPPASIDNGPTSEQPDANHFWVAGHWQWYDSRYAWQPGYWAVSQPDWIWVPATYYWCPSGWVYVPGYWDYPLARRGVVFSPVYFARPVAVYRPAVCLDVGVLSFSLFCRPAYCHYYFGDYYDDHYVAIGIRPWFYYNSWHHGYDPLFGYYRWYHEDHMGEREWGNHLAGWHEYYRVHPDMRPPHTLEAQRALIASGAMRNRPDARQLYMAHDVHQVDAHAAGAMRMTQVSAAQHVQLAQAARETTHFQQERQQFERSATAGARGPSQPARANLTTMPSFRSNTLPGASAANVQASASRTSTAAGNMSVGASGAGNTAGGRSISAGGTGYSGAAAAAAGRAVGSSGQAVGSNAGAAAAAGRAAGPTGQAMGSNPGTAATGRAVGPNGQPATGRTGGQPGGGSGRSFANPNRGDNRNKNDKDKSHN
jgi:hypothetical protein